MPVIRTALVTARSAPAHERVIRTLRAWGIRIDEAFFMGGMDKSQILEAFGAHIFFDDNEENVESASAVVLSARVNWEEETMEQQVGKKMRKKNSRSTLAYAILLGYEILE